MQCSRTESSVDDLRTSRGVVSGWAASSLRSAETLPLTGGFVCATRWSDPRNGRQAIGGSRRRPRLGSGPPAGGDWTAPTPSSEGRAVHSPGRGTQWGEMERALPSLPHEYFSDGQTIPWTLAPSHPSPPGLPRTRADYPPGSLTLSLELSLTPWLAKPPFRRVRATASIFPGSQGCRWTRQTIPWTLAPSHSCLSCLSHLGSRADIF